MEIRKAQQLVWDNKVAKGFDSGDVPTEFCYIQGELAEAFEAWRTKSDNLGEELADVALYVMGLATKTGIDLQDEMERKIAKNAKRVYVTDPRTGSHLRVHDGD